MRVFSEEKQAFVTKCDVCFATSDQSFVMTIGQVHALDLCNGCTVKMWKIVTLIKEGLLPQFD